MNRNLDGCYFRICRNGKWQNICFSDLTKSERELALDGRNTEWVKSLCNILADTIQNIGEEFNLVGGYDERQD